MAASTLGRIGPGLELRRVPTAGPAVATDRGRATPPAEIDVVDIAEQKKTIRTELAGQQRAGIILSSRPQRSANGLRRRVPPGCPHRRRK
jgi:hypothetical protein